MQTSISTIKRLTENIVRLVGPLRIILFGSTARGGARGEWDAESDVDLLVVMPEGAHRRHTAQFLYREIRGAGVPFDLIVAVPSDLERHRDNPVLIYKTIIEEGREIYARAEILR
uniref:Nucleotidyltransferase domain-containing protein n=1 Tax=Candidatus Kentrum sp. SD TaxID=2126332 RepID=A0A451BN28_9GAMM|nr:MAG: Nucleotidyltransferase domain-containing protein [Candidatus Kentron sp. SD]VFK48116.1 MAG: Nucleotidyltransferase domain-containing protein [Candidatus Kentron sp. SD]VFK79637.1 MAG: Nucleotidyltransferase domain-containing protein [Candidatus Kentron sp. SD]